MAFYVRLQKRLDGSVEQDGVVCAVRKTILLKTIALTHGFFKGLVFRKLRTSVLNAVRIMFMVFGFSDTFIGVK